MIRPSRVFLATAGIQLLISIQMVASTEVVHPTPLSESEMVLWKIVMPITSYFGWPEDLWVGLLLNSITWAITVTLVVRVMTRAKKGG